MVSREAERVEQELLIEQIKVSVATHLFKSFFVESVTYDRYANAYVVKILGAGKDRYGHRVQCKYLGSFPAEQLDTAATPTMWNGQMRQNCNTWMEEMRKLLLMNGAVLIDGSPAVDFKLDTSKLAQSMAEAAKKIEDLRNGIFRLKTSVDSFSVVMEEGPVSKKELADIEKSLKQSAERRAQRNQ